MTFTFANLDTRTRQYMCEEIDHDISQGNLYYSQRLNKQGREKYANLLKEAVQNHDVEWLAQQLRGGGLMHTVEQRQTPKSGLTTVKVPKNAPDMLAEGEFNRFYIRGVCCRALTDGITDLVVYRAKTVSKPRPESQAKINTPISAQSLLDDLRTHQGVDTALGLPGGPNSGLSVKLPE